jgi:hypothetical protein
MAKKRVSATAVPEPVKISSRNCFGIAFFASELDAKLYDAYVRTKGDTYNGGFYHGESCGRDSGFDYVDPTLGPLFAVTTR